MSNLDHRLATLARRGLSARASGKILRAEGHDVSDSTVGRRMAALLGRQRVTSRTRTPTRPPAPEALELEELVARALLAWIDAQPDPEAAEAMVHALLDAHHAKGEAIRVTATEGGSR